MLDKFQMLLSCSDISAAELEPITQLNQSGLRFCDQTWQIKEG